MRICHLVLLITVVAGISSAQEKGGAKPATVAEAVKVLDLATFPLMKGANEPSERNVARLSYNVPSDCKAESN